MFILNYFCCLTVEVQMCRVLCWQCVVCTLLVLAKHLQPELGNQLVQSVVKLCLTRTTSEQISFTVLTPFIAVVMPMTILVHMIMSMATSVRSTAMTLMPMSVYMTIFVSMIFSMIMMMSMPLTMIRSMTAFACTMTFTEMVIMYIFMASPTSMVITMIIILAIFCTVSVIMFMSMSTCLVKTMIMIVMRMMTSMTMLATKTTTVHFCKRNCI